MALGAAASAGVPFTASRVRADESGVVPLGTTEAMSPQASEGAGFAPDDSVAASEPEDPLPAPAEEPAAPAPPSVDPNPAALGPYLARPSETEMSVWFESDHGAPDFAEARAHASGRRSIAPFVEIEGGVFLATFTNLLPDTVYAYRFVDTRGGVHGSTFRTFPAERSITQIALGADIHPWSAPHTIYDRLADRAPHVYVGLGDQVYADVDLHLVPEPTREGYAKLYRRSWADPSIARFFSEVPAALVWDDHEIWNDYDGTSNEDRFLAGRQAYRRYQRSRMRERTPWSIVRIGAAEIFLLDTRTHRDPNYAEDGPTKTMLGGPQREALFHWIRTSRAGLRIVASPTPFHRYVTTGRDGWAYGFANERNALFAELEAHDPRTVLLVSGDQHWPGVFQHPLANGGHLIELQCTPTAAFFRPPPTEYGPDAWYVDGDHLGYGWLTVDGSGPEVRARFAWTDLEGRERYVLEHPTMQRVPTSQIETPAGRRDPA